MRIISGQFGGRILKAPPTQARFRPTTGRVRESLFNILAHSTGFEGNRVLDLFAGTGALGIEALSRGAQHAVLVESNRKHAGIIRENIGALGIESSAMLVTASVEAYLKSATDTFDIIFCDPPYDYTALTDILAIITQKGLLDHQGLCCIEHSGKSDVGLPDGWVVVQTKKYGTTSITIVEQAGA